MNLRSLERLFGCGVVFHYPGMAVPLADRRVSFKMGRLFTGSWRSVLGYASPMRGRRMRGRDGLMLDIRGGVGALLLIPWLSLHEFIHIFAVEYSVRRGVVFLAPMFFHVCSLVLITVGLAFSLSHRDLLDFLVLWMLLTQHVVLLAGSRGDLESYLAFREFDRLQLTAMSHFADVVEMEGAP